MADSINVFQDCVLTAHGSSREEIRKALIDCVASPWSHGQEREREIASNAVGDVDVIAFERQSGEGLPAASLVLWRDQNGYYVSNIVPMKSNQLNFDQYNSLLQDFAKNIITPATRRVNFDVQLTSSRQSINDWASPTVAKALKNFSAAANKSTGSSHPLDRERWFKFIVDAHREDSSLDAGRLARWLHEVEGWDDDSAHKLAVEYEFGRDLLNVFDPHST